MKTEGDNSGKCLEIYLIKQKFSILVIVIFISVFIIVMYHILGLYKPFKKVGFFSIIVLIKNMSSIR